MPVETKTIETVTITPLEIRVLVGENYNEQFTPDQLEKAICDLLNAKNADGWGVKILDVRTAADPTVRQWTDVPIVAQHFVPDAWTALGINAR
jgi:hypothetical protein